MRKLTEKQEIIRRMPYFVLFALLKHNALHEFCNNMITTASPHILKTENEWLITRFQWRTSLEGYQFWFNVYITYIEAKQKDASKQLRKMPRIF